MVRVVGETDTPRSSSSVKVTVAVEGRPSVTLLSGRVPKLIVTLSPSSSMSSSAAVTVKLFCCSPGRKVTLDGIPR